tara:strand:- start:37 stop:303 length:267 start_codon:yes stop_codon:yes gene_type:complete
MAQTLEAIVIMLIVWQVMTRFRRNVRLRPDAKSELKEAINDAKNRLPSTGLFALFKRDQSSPLTADEPKMELDQTIVPAIGDEMKDSE